MWCPRSIHNCTQYIFVLQYDSVSKPSLTPPRFSTELDTVLYVLAMSATSEPAPPTRRRAHTRVRLLDAARELFAEQGVNGTAVEDLCARAGFTRGAFYSNFSDKDDLVLALLEADRQVVLDQLTGALATDYPDVATALGVVMETIESENTRLHYLSRTEMTLHAIRTPAVATTLVRQRSEFRSRLAEVVSEALVRAGVELDLDVDTLVRAVEALNDGAIPQSLLEPDVIPDGELQRLLVPRLMQACTRSD